MKVIKIPVGGEPTVTDLADELASLQQAVGGYIEAIWLAPNVCMLINEEGKLNCEDVNEPGTFLFQHYTDSFYDYIAGDAVIVGTSNDVFTDLAESDVEEIMALLAAMQI